MKVIGRLSRTGSAAAPAAVASFSVASVVVMSLVLESGRAEDKEHMRPASSGFDLSSRRSCR